MLIEYLQKPCKLTRKKLNNEYVLELLHNLGLNGVIYLTQILQNYNLYTYYITHKFGHFKLIPLSFFPNVTLLK